MIIDKPGKVTDRIILLGRKESSIYMLKGGSEYALIGGGMIHIVPEVIKQLNDFGIEEEKIKRIIILHSHFDHCGIVPFFKKRWPRAIVTASERAKVLLSSPAVEKNIRNMGQVLLENYGRKEEAEELGIEFSGIEVEETVKGGDILTAGDLSMEVIDVPGHSSCSIALYVPEEKAIFASDAGGIPVGDSVFASANSNFDLFQSSLEKMAGYDIEVHLAGHNGAFTGEDGRNFIQRTIESTKTTRKMIENVYKQTGNEDKTTEEITELFLKGSTDLFLPREVLSMVIGQMTRFIAKKMS